jgi:hypothetical protein
MFSASSKSTASRSAKKQPSLALIHSATSTANATETTYLLSIPTGTNSSSTGIKFGLFLIVLLAVCTTGYVISSFYNGTSERLAVVDRYRDHVKQELDDLESKERNRVKEAWASVDEHRQSVYRELDDLKRQTHQNITVEWHQLDAHRDDVAKELKFLKDCQKTIQQRIDDMKEAEWQEDERRKSLRLYWDFTRPDVHCSSYATKYYSSELMNLPGDKFDAIGACYKTSNTINGVEYSKPLWCEEQYGGAVIGHWRVTDDILCKPWWSNLTDKGCTEKGSGQRRWEQHMENLFNHDDWSDICQTMPATFNGRHFAKPTYCADWVRAL